MKHNRLSKDESSKSIKRSSRFQSTWSTFLRFLNKLVKVGHAEGQIMGNCKQWQWKGHADLHYLWTIVPSLHVGRLRLSHSKPLEAWLNHRCWCWRWRKPRFSHQICLRNITKDFLEMKSYLYRRSSKDQNLRSEQFFEKINFDFFLQFPLWLLTIQVW